jgi:type VI secretion system protein ImpA
MSPQWNAAALQEPLSPDEPCGKSLEDTDALSAFDAYQIFGQTTLEPPEDGEAGEAARREPRKSDRPPNWDEIRDLSLETLARSKDLRVLAHLAAALVRTDGIAAFGQILGVASHWVTSYWPQVFPRLEDGDAIFRQSALNCFADRVAVIEGLRRVPLVTSRQHGRISWRDIEIVSGAVAAGSADAPPDEARISAAFDEMPFAELKALQQSVAGSGTTLRTMDEAMRQEAGIEAAPTFEPLVTLLKKMDAALQERIGRHPEAVAQGAVAGATAEDGVIAVGSIRSRQDAIRALEAAAEFFRRNEPSSPIPLIVDRAKRLVAKDFLEVLADVAPDAVQQARWAAGLRD